MLLNVPYNWCVTSRLEVKILPQGGSPTQMQQSLFQGDEQDGEQKMLPGAGWRKELLSCVTLKWAKGFEILRLEVLFFCWTSLIAFHCYGHVTQSREASISELPRKRFFCWRVMLNFWVCFVNKKEWCLLTRWTVVIRLEDSKYLGRDTLLVYVDRVSDSSFWPDRTLKSCLISSNMRFSAKSPTAIEFITIVCLVCHAGLWQATVAYFGTEFIITEATVHTKLMSFDFIGSLCETDG